MTQQGDTVAYPGLDEVGRRGEWTLPTVNGEGPLVLRGRFLGMSQSWHPDHLDRARNLIHPDYDHALKGQRCPTCRWFEPRIFREADGHRRFLIYQVGRSVVPGEIDFARYDWARNAVEALEILVSRDRGRPVLTAINARCFSQAAGFDDDLLDAWENRSEGL